MEKKPTNEMDDLLAGTKPDQLEDYYKKNERYLAEGKKAFYYYMKDVLDKKAIKLKDVYSFAGVSESYGSKILTMEKHTKDRDLIIRLCLAGHFSWEETSRALKLYGFSELYSKEPRDACIIVAVNNRIYDLYRVDAMLAEHGFERLMKDI